MMHFLVPVDGSENSERALCFVISLCEHCGPIGIKLLHVEARPGVVDTAAGKADAATRGVDTAPAALAAAERLLDHAGIKYLSEVRQDRGYMPGAIADYARETGCAAIVMGTRGLGSTGDVLGSIARQVVAHAGVPVTLVK